MNNLSKEFWENRWQQQQTGWDLGMVSPPLKSYIDTLTHKHLRILIPGCGNAHEAEYLLQQGFTSVTVIDIAPTLTQQLAHKLENYVREGFLNVITADFFDHQGTYDLILEQTFFCAIDPSLRNSYAQHTHGLLANGGRVAGVLFARKFEGGPPFGGTQQEYQSYFTPLFDLVQMEPCYNSAKPREGAELFIILQKNAT